MRRVGPRRLPGGLCVCAAVLLALPSVGITQQQEEGKPIIGALGRAYAGGAIGGGLALALGASMVYEESEGSEALMIPALLLCEAGFILGSARGIELWDKEHYSPGWTTLGAAVPPAVGAVIGAVKEGFSYDTLYSTAWLGSVLLGSLASPLGATVGYALSRHVQPATTGALLHIEGGELWLGSPRPWSGRFCSQGTKSLGSTRLRWLVHDFDWPEVTR